jgi:hypothetical protein
MLASTSRVQLRTAIEATFGSVTAATARRTVRMTGESFNYALSFENSKEIRSDRQIADQILLGASASGGFNFEASYNEHDEFFEDAMQATFLAFGTAGVSPTLTAPTFAANSLTQTAGTTFATIEKGQWFRVSGCTGVWVANNGVHQASLTVAPTATVIETATTFPQTGAATGTVVISTSRLKNGTTQRSRLFEVEFADITQFLTFRGQVDSKLSLQFGSQAVLTGSFEYMGADAMALAGASNIPGTDSVSFPTAYDVLNTSSNVAYLYEGGAALSGTYAKSVSFDIDNALRAQTAIANTAPVGCGSGTLKVTGKLSAYFANATLYDKFVNSTESSIACVVEDADGNGYAFTVPCVKFTGAQLVAGSMDQDIMVDLDFAAKIDTVSGKMFLIDRFGVAVV